MDLVAESQISTKSIDQKQKSHPQTASAAPPSVQNYASPPTPQVKDPETCALTSHSLQQAN